MAELAAIVAHLDALLEPERFRDFCPNGLQVPGRDKVTTLVTGVSAGAELFERAAEHEAAAILVHHGLFWDGAPRALDRPAARRLKLLLEREISLLAYHLPLDGHQEHGNNALLAAALGCEAWRPFPADESPAIGVAGTFGESGIDSAVLVERVTTATGGRAPLAFTDGPDTVRSIGIVSGGASSYLATAIGEGLDAFLTGEPTERVMLQAREAGIHFLAAGHYATETLGVRRLGDLLAERFGIEHVFVDVPNPI
jgi:dinuclear metal center YbgI/SA1388 family protein